MKLKHIFKAQEALIGVDIGASSIKLVELDLSYEPAKLLNLAVVPLGLDTFSGYSIAKSEKAGDKITSLLESNSIVDRRVVTAVPGPSVFTKRIKMPKMSLGELGEHVRFEAGNFIPHNIEAVKLDFHVIGESGKSQLDILLVAVKNEIIDSYLDSFALGGVETAIVDVDAFAIQNIFEFSYPHLIEKTIALINIGTRYTSINICRGGECLIIGDMSLGGKQLTDQLVENMDLSFDEAEKQKKRAESPMVTEAIDSFVESAAAELNRQLSFFLNATGEDVGIDAIYLSGGGALVRGLPEELAEKTGVEVQRLDPFKAIDVSSGFDSSYLQEVGNIVGVAAGLALRQPGDKDTAALN